LTIRTDSLTSPPVLLELRSYLDAATWMREWLDRHAVTVNPSSIFGRSLGALQTMGEIVKNRSGIVDGESIILALNAGMIAYAVRRAVEKAPRLVDGYASLFRGADVALAQPGLRTRERDSMWELFVGTAAVHLFDGVVLGGTHNPDVGFSFRGRKWGVECKMLHSPNPQAVVKAVAEAAKQLATAVDAGWIAVNVTNLVGPGLSYGSGNGPPVDIDREVGRLAEALFASRGRRRLSKFLESPRGTARGVILVGMSVILAPDRPMLTAAIRGRTLFPLLSDDSACVDRLLAGIRISLGLDEGLAQPDLV
jgi:hypothetical protein